MSFPVPSHPVGDQPVVASKLEPAVEIAAPSEVFIDSYAGRVHVEWDTEVPLTPLGQLPFFVDYLKVSGLFDGWVADCPLAYTSSNRPQTRDVLGTVMLSFLSGHRRYAHIAALRGDGVLPELLGMKKVVSEDAVRRAYAAIAEQAGLAWLDRHLERCTAPLLGEAWILDVDTTVKLLYGHQEGAVVGYNPTRPGRPSHSYHTYILGNLRLILGVEVHAGNEHMSKHTGPGLWAMLDRIGRNHWPVLLRGDSGFGNEPVMVEAERRGLPYLFKLRLTANVKKAINRAMSDRDWRDAGHGWQGKKKAIRLIGWSRQRRIVMLRRRLGGPPEVTQDNAHGQLLLGFAEVGPNKEMYEYAALVTSLDDEILTFGQLYRDRADAENNFDELKNQWGWGGFTTQDLHRCRLMAASMALIYNWWNLFVRLVEPDRHMEAITSRPLFMHAIAAKTRHAGQTTLRIVSSHAKASWAAEVLAKAAAFLRDLLASAEQLTDEQLWYEILSYAMRKYLKGRKLRAPPRRATA
jgi:hypothetical protein